MADPNNPALAALVDIIEPEFSRHFALAPIYWLLLVSVLAFLAVITWKLIQRNRYWLAKRQAIKLLVTLHNKPDAATQINQLLKRVLQHYQPSHPALSASTEQWQHWLAKQCTLALPNLNQLLYQAQSTPAALEQFFAFAQQWLKQYNATADNNGITIPKPTTQKMEQQDA